MSARRAILVLEKPWKLDARDANRASVLPFIQGMARYEGNLDVCHANFYDESSLLDALDTLCHAAYNHAIVYVAAHGDETSAGCELTPLFAAIRKRAEAANIRGVLLGSCLAGLPTRAHEIALEGSALRWCVGYASECDWMTGTMIDCALLQNAIRLTERSYARDNLVKRFAQAISPFSPGHRIGKDIHGEPMALAGSLQFVIQSPGRGQRAETISADVFEEHGRLQLD